MDSLRSEEEKCHLNRCNDWIYYGKIVKLKPLSITKLNYFYQNMHILRGPHDKREFL